MEYEVVKLPSFEADLEKHQINKEKFDKFVLALSQKPAYLKDAHALKSTLSPLWSADFNTQSGLFIVLYFICEGKPERCFRMRADKNTIYINSQTELEHTCTLGKVFLCRLGRHNIYDILK
jgi:homogentisate 1,2-dioxygenase